MTVFTALTRRTCSADSLPLPCPFDLKIQLQELQCVPLLLYLEQQPQTPAYIEFRLEAINIFTDDRN